MEDLAPVSPLPQDLAAFRHRVADPEAARTVPQHNAQALRDARVCGVIVETIRDPLLVLTADLRVRVANPAFYHVSGAPGGDRRPADLSAGPWAMGYPSVADVTGRAVATEYGLQ